MFRRLACASRKLPVPVAQTRFIQEINDPSISNDSHFAIKAGSLMTSMTLSTGASTKKVFSVFILSPPCHEERTFMGTFPSGEHTTSKSLTNPCSLPVRFNQRFGVPTIQQRIIILKTIDESVLLLRSSDEKKYLRPQPGTAPCTKHAILEAYEKSRRED